MKKFKWNDTLALEFARVSQGGAYGPYKGCTSIGSKLKRFKELKTMKEVNTNVWIIVDEEDLKVVKAKCGSEALTFRTPEEANAYACQRLNMWSVFHIHFNHRWLQHKPNFPKSD
jgi:hypothetical protein